MYENEVLGTKNNYEAWLEMSNLSERELINFRTKSNFKVLCEKDEQNEYLLVFLGYISNDRFVKIGEHFTFKASDEEAFLDLSMLLFYIAQKMDEANEKAPKFEQRPRYFYEKVKEFVKNEKEKFLL